MKRSVVAASVLAFALACGGSERAAAPPTSSSPPGPVATSPSPGAGFACGLKFYGDAYDGECQRALDQTCCADERACGANADCSGLIACVNGCPRGRGRESEGCMNQCASKGGQPPGYVLFDRLTTCSKHMPPTATRCSWP